MESKDSVAVPDEWGMYPASQTLVTLISAIAVIAYGKHPWIGNLTDRGNGTVHDNYFRLSAWNQVDEDAGKPQFSCEHLGLEVWWHGNIRRACWTNRPISDREAIEMFYDITGSFVANNQVYEAWNGS